MSKSVEEMLPLVMAAKSDEDGARLLEAEWGGWWEDNLLDAHVMRGGKDYIDIVPLPDLHQ